ncbi:light-independent protochlorophyllide reductase subunit N [Striga asiatica]|uniref:Light-independent protochlorophyllide reductase subunit N n=1 Tax=Striga asiatica TaxID=4170 RepID=A0A5A7R2Y6_STRAF|nr:light-independent protochlorophyllide reductase subunit N [Striga asiatica]
MKASFQPGFGSEIESAREASRRSAASSPSPSAGNWVAGGSGPVVRFLIVGLVSGLLGGSKIGSEIIVAVVVLAVVGADVAAEVVEFRVRVRMAARCRERRRAQTRRLMLVTKL